MRTYDIFEMPEVFQFNMYIKLHSKFGDDKLDMIFDNQYKFGSKFTKFNAIANIFKNQDRSSINDRAIAQNCVLEFISHTIEELIELRREFPIRKHWSVNQNKKVNIDKAKEELVDALHFFVSIALLLGIDSGTLFDAYIIKNKKNHIRQKEGY